MTRTELFDLVEGVMVCSIALAILAATVYGSLIILSA